MADDIVTRLRNHMVPDLPGDVCIRCKAADEIELLNTTLDKALDNLERLRLELAVVTAQRDRTLARYEHALERLDLTHDNHAWARRQNRTNG